MDEPEPLSPVDAVEATVNALVARVDAVEATIAAQVITVNDLVARVGSLARDLAEVAHDLEAIVGLLSRQNGEPFRSLAADIIGKRQVTRPPVREERR